MTRMFFGVLLAPWFYVLVWSSPLLGDPAFHSWVVINIFLAYLVFLGLAGIAHVVLNNRNKTSIYAYVGVMFMVAALLDFIVSVLILRGFYSNYYSHTQVVENGSITAAGYLLQIRECLIHGLISAGAMAIFWITAIWKPSSKTA